MAKIKYVCGCGVEIWSDEKDPAPIHCGKPMKPSGEAKVYR